MEIEKKLELEDREVRVKGEREEREIELEVT